MTAYYNEIDPFAAQWLRNLIATGHIAPGDVDERDIRDVVPAELSRYTQCHFFAGIGIWSHALRLAGWDDSRPVWTGSCPCQPFSSAGKGDGFADERHLWPFWHHLIRVQMPAVVFGEQVADGDGAAWIDLVHDDMEDLAFAIGPIGAPAAGFGAPNGRHRFFFVAYAADGGWRAGLKDTGEAWNELHTIGGGEPLDMANPSPSGWRALQRTGGTNGRETFEPDGHGDFGSMADTNPSGLRQQRSAQLFDGERPAHGNDVDGCSEIGGMGHPSSQGSRRNSRAIPRSQDEGESERSGAWPLVDELEPAGDAGELGDAEQGRRSRSIAGLAGSGGSPCSEWRPQADGVEGSSDISELGDAGRTGFQIGSLPDGRRGIIRIKGPAAAQAGVVSGFWRDADLILCRDEKDGQPDWKWRPVEEGTFPLAAGDPGRVGCLRAYGNAINAQVAAHFIRVAMEVMP